MQFSAPAYHFFSRISKHSSQRLSFPIPSFVRQCFLQTSAITHVQRQAWSLLPLLWTWN